MTKISFVIPCYKSCNVISQVIYRIIKTVNTRKEYDYEIILVNDNEPDETWDVIINLAKQDLHIKAFCLSKNFGQHSALMAGYKNVTGDIIVSLDDDGQNPPEEMFKLIDALQDNVDLVYAKYDQKKHSTFRNFGSKINDEMVKLLLNKPKDLYLASYFVAKRFVIDNMVQCENPFPYIDGLALGSTSSYKNVKIEHRERVSGKSGYTIGKLIGLWMNGFTAFSVKPLRIASFLGFLTSTAGFLFALIVILQKIIMKNYISEGWASIMTVVLILIGAMMMMLGLLGEYIGRIYITINKNPQYVIKYRFEHTENDKADINE